MGFACLGSRLCRRLIPCAIGECRDRDEITAALPFTEEELLAADRARNSAKSRAPFTGKLTPDEEDLLRKEEQQRETREGPGVEEQSHPWARRYPFTP